ncbi:MAG TPA: hypothetical protein VGQ80_18130, partial [Acidimicrobiia bacterium]|nr:hypothetical protein [Acidimicrobiia bacterium]
MGERRMWSSKRRSAIAVAGLLIGGAGLLLPAPASGESADAGSYTAVARADGFAIRFVDPSLPAVPEGRIENTSSSAQALIDSFGASRAFASAPYIELAATLTETIAGFTNGQLSLPSYPFVVFSDHPTAPDAKKETGPYSLHAASTAGASTAETRAGASTADPHLFSFTSTAVARRDEATGAVDAVAQNQATGVAVADVLRVGTVGSKADVTQNPGHGPKKTSALDVTGLSVGGVALTVKDDGIHVGDATLPKVDMSAVNAALAERGATLAYLPTVETETGIVAAGLEVTYHTEAPGQAPVTVAVVFGRASASIASAGSGLASLPGAGPDGTSVITPLPSSTTTPVGGTGPADSGSDSTGGFTGSGSSPSTGETNPLPAGQLIAAPPADAMSGSGPPAAVVPPGLVSGGAGVRRAVTGRWAARFYVVVVFASLVALAG